MTKGAGYKGWRLKFMAKPKEVDGYAGEKLHYLEVALYWRLRSTSSPTT